MHFGNVELLPFVSLHTHPLTNTYWVNFSSSPPHLQRREQTQKSFIDLGEDSDEEVEGVEETDFAPAHSVISPASLPPIEVSASLNTDSYILIY